MRIFGVILVLLVLASCDRRQSFRDVPITQEVPIVGIAAVPGQPVLQLDGFVRADPNGNALLRMSGGPIACEGLFGRDGRGVLFCSNGVDIPVTIPREVYVNPNGNGVIAGGRGGRLALGWGRSANAQFVASLL